MNPFRCSTLQLPDFALHYPWYQYITIFLSVVANKKTNISSSADSGPEIEAADWARDGGSSPWQTTLGAKLRRAKRAAQATTHREQQQAGSREDRREESWGHKCPVLIGVTRHGSRSNQTQVAEESRGVKRTKLPGAALVGERTSLPHAGRAVPGERRDVLPEVGGHQLLPPTNRRRRHARAPYSPFAGSLKLRDSAM